MGLDEAAKKVKSLPATVTAAMQIKTLHHHKKHRHGDNSALLQQEEEAKKKSIEAALDKAKLTLSNMMEETKEEMDKAILTCTEFDSQTVSTLDINKGYRAQLAAQVAEAKGFIAQAKMMISEATTELDSLKTISEEHAQQCFITITAKQEGLAILESDLSVSMKVENMTSCDDVTPGSTTTLMQCGTGYSRRFQFAGSAAQEYAQLKTKEGMLAVQRTAKIMLGENLGEDSYEDKTFQPTRRITRKGLVKTHRELPIKTKNGLVQVVKRVGSTPSPVEASLCGGRRGACEHDYGDLARAGLVQPGRLDGEVHGERESVVPDAPGRPLAAHLRGPARARPGRVRAVRDRGGPQAPRGGVRAPDPAVGGAVGRQQRQIVGADRCAQHRRAGLGGQSRRGERVAQTAQGFPRGLREEDQGGCRDDLWNQVDSSGALPDAELQPLH